MYCTFIRPSEVPTQCPLAFLKVDPLRQLLDHLAIIRHSHHKQAISPVCASYRFAFARAHHGHRPLLHIGEHFIDGDLERLQLLEDIRCAVIGAKSGPNINGLLY